MRILFGAAAYIPAGGHGGLFLVADGRTLSCDYILLFGALRGDIIVDCAIWAVWLKPFDCDIVW